jgi:sterol desaturase/sphingolipid hydroxylase (fatty acid hydroxylase superfamily)
MELEIWGITVGQVLIWVLQAFVVFVASSLLFDALHWLLHRWGRSRNRLLRRFSRWHWVHHRFLDRKMQVHPELVWKNIVYHVLPEAGTALAGTVAFLLVFPWQPVAAVVVVRLIMLGFVIKDEGMDVNHMSMDRVGGRQGLWWVNANYHAMHHVYPNNFFSSLSNVFDLVFGTTCQFKNRKFVVTGAGGAFGGALVRRLEKLGAEVRTLRHGEHFAPGLVSDEAHETLAWADVVVLSHGAKSVDCWNANVVTFVQLIDLVEAMGRSRLVAPEVWALGSEAEFHGDFGLESLRAYAASKRTFATHAKRYYRSPDLIYRHIVPSAFTSVMGPGLISADSAVSIALFFIRRGFRYVPVTYTTLALWNYVRFRLLKAADAGGLEVPSTAAAP